MVSIDGLNIQSFSETASHPIYVDSSPPLNSLHNIRSRTSWDILRPILFPAEYMNAKWRSPQTLVAFRMPPRCAMNQLSLQCISMCPSRHWCARPEAWWPALLSYMSFNFARRNRGAVAKSSRPHFPVLTWTWCAGVERGCWCVGLGSDATSPKPAEPRVLAREECQNILRQRGRFLFILAHGHLQIEPRVMSIFVITRHSLGYWTRSSSLGSSLRLEQ